MVTDDKIKGSTGTGNHASLAAATLWLLTIHSLARLKHDAFHYQLHRTQDGIDTCWKTHPCYQSEGGEFDPSKVRLVEQRNVTLISHAGQGSLVMPLWECNWTMACLQAGIRRGAMSPFDTRCTNMLSMSIPMLVPSLTARLSWEAVCSLSD